MRFMTMVKSAESMPAGPPPPELFAAIAKLGEDAAKAGVLVEMGGLMPSAAGALIRISGGKIVATDGPFTEAKEVIGGYAVYDLKSKAEAMEWGRRFMELHLRLWKGWEGVAEIRQIMDAPPDFGSR